MSHEGQYSNDPRDLGGETWKGISRKNYPDWAGWEIIDQIKANVSERDLVKALRADDELDELVIQFYNSEFWEKLLLDQIKEQDIAAELFDTAINQASVKAVKSFQEALNLLNNNQKHYSDIVIDGHIGPGTLKAYAAYMLTSNFPGRSTERNIRTLLKVMNGLQFERYTEICRDHPDQEVYFYGWMNRV
jgi:lysozyme family protein